MYLMEREREYGVKYGKEAMAADKDYIQSAAYASKFNSITDNQAVNEKLCELSRKAIEENDGTSYESLYLVNGNDGSLIAGIDRPKEKREGYVEYTKDFVDKLEDANTNHVPIIALHNHGEGMPPSADDFLKAYENGYEVAVISGHNGQVYSYSNKTVELTREQCDDIHRMVNQFYRQGYDADNAHITIYNEWSLKYNILEEET